MNIIKKEVLKLLYHNPDGLRIRDLMIKMPTIREIDNDLRVNSRGYATLVHHLSIMRRWGLIKKIRYDKRDKNFTKDGEVFWIITNNTRKNKYDYLMRRGN